MVADRLGNFFPIVNPFDTIFAAPVTGATLAMVTNPGTYTFTALLNGATVESFSTATILASPNKFYGFTTILFDTIRVNAGGSDNALLLDDLGFVTAAVTLSPNGLMLVAGLGGLTLLQRRPHGAMPAELDQPERTRAGGCELA